MRYFANSQAHSPNMAKSIALLTSAESQFRLRGLLTSADYRRSMRRTAFMGEAPMPHQAAHRVSTKQAAIAIFCRAVCGSPHMSRL
jgi:hypothetical protein